MGRRGLSDLQALDTERVTTKTDTYLMETIVSLVLISLLFHLQPIGKSSLMMTWL